MTAPAYPNLHRIAYGEGARLTAEARVEAADALERLAHLERWKAEALTSLSEWHELEALVPEDFTYARLGQRWPQVVAAYIASLAPPSDPFAADEAAMYEAMDNQ